MKYYGPILIYGGMALCSVVLAAQDINYVYDPPGNLTVVGPIRAGPPVISAQPQSQLLQTNGAVQFSVFASGTGLFYQWLSNGIPILGATNASLTVNETIPTNWVLNGGAVLDASGVLTLTDGQNTESRSAYANVRQAITNFTTSFTYQDVNTGGADGAAFVLQNSPSGFNALGGAGGGLGFSGVSPSAAIEFNLYSGSPGGEGVAFETNGLTAISGGQPYFNPTPVNLGNGHPIGVTINYLAGTLSLALTDAVANVSFMTNYSVNLSAVLGSSNAYVGFSGGSGGISSVQQISHFTFLGGGNSQPLSFIPANSSFSVIVSNSSGSVTSAPALIALDLNGNGIPDWWESQYFGNANQTADGDYDGDGVNNLNEYLEGTDPTNPNSFDPRLHLSAVNGRVIVSPVLPFYTNGQTVTLTALPDPGQSFIGWSGSITGTNSVTSMVMNAHKTIAANFGLSLPVAIATPGLPWTTSGNTPWFGQTAISVNGIGAAQSGLITGGQQSILQLVTNLAQTTHITFWWNVSSQPPDALTFAVDGTACASISGNSGEWQFIQTNIPSGNHTLTWTYSKTSNDNPIGAPYADAGWLDEVTMDFPANFPYFTVQPASQIVSQGAPASFTATVVGTVSLNYQWYQNGVALQGATNLNLVLANAQQNITTYSLLATDPMGRAAMSDVVSLIVYSANCIAPPSGLIDWWPADGSAHDIVGTNNGTISAGLTFSPGETGNCFNFNGTTSYVDLGNWFNLQTFTIAFWVNARVNQQQYADMIDNNHSSVNWNIEYQNSGLEFMWGEDNGSSCCVPFSLTPDQWQYLAISRDTNNTTQVYLDGVLVGTASGGPIYYDGNQDFRLGSWVKGGRNFNGELDEVTVFNRALTAQEVQTIYANGAFGMCKQPIFSTAPDALRWSTNGLQVQLNGVNRLGSAVIYASTDLKTWTPIFTNAPTNGTIRFLDNSATNFPYRFYRAVLQ